MRLATKIVLLIFRKLKSLIETSFTKKILNQEKYDSKKGKVKHNELLFRTIQMYEVLKRIQETFILTHYIFQW